MVVGLHGSLGLAWVAWVVSLMIGLFSLPAVSDWTHAVLGPRQHQVDAQKIGKWVTGVGGQADTALEGTAYTPQDAAPARVQLQTCGTRTFQRPPATT